MKALIEAYNAELKEQGAQEYRAQSEKSEAQRRKAVNVADVVHVLWANRSPPTATIDGLNVNIAWRYSCPMLAFVRELHGCTRGEHAVEGIPHMITAHVSVKETELQLHVSIRSTSGSTIDWAVRIMCVLRALEQDSRSMLCSLNGFVDELYRAVQPSVVTRLSAALREAEANIADLEDSVRNIKAEIAKHGEWPQHA